MKRDNQPWRGVTRAELAWHSGRHPAQSNPFSTRFGDVYYSRENGAEESRHVFLRGNDLLRRMADFPGPVFCIGETGFGTGLNFLLTWQAWRALPQPRPRLHYLSLEKYPLPTEDLSRALSAWPQLAELTRGLLDNYPPSIHGCHRLQLDEGDVILDLWWEDALDALSDLASRERPLIDAWYLDGFAPSQNASLWSSDLLSRVATLSRPGASFATFTAAGQVRRDLEAAGFDVVKAPGYGRKRECLRGTLRQAPPSPPVTATPWDLAAIPGAWPESVLVVGGGLAGCTTAAALARRGVRVTLLESGELASQGSGNEQGILYTRLSRRHSPLADFALLSFAFASRYYQHMLTAEELREGLDGKLCGSFHQSTDLKDMDYLSQALVGLEQLARVVDSRQASELIGLDQGSPGYWYPRSGWLRPASICRALAARPGIEVITNCGDLHLKYRDSRWQALAGGKTLAGASCAVIATGTAAPEQPGLDWLPLQSIRGQTTQLPSNSTLAELRAALCHEGYIAPAREAEHCIGATFDLDDGDPDLRPEDHLRNLRALARAAPALESLIDNINPQQLSGRVGYRCASPDYLPLVGPAPDFTAFLRDFAPLRKNARQTLLHRGPCMPGLYLNTAHGSRGLSSTPLAAELLASDICGEPPPLSRDLARALSPARFIIRDLGRNRL